MSRRRVALLAALAGAAGCVTASASPRVGLDVLPSLLEIPMRPGERAERAVTLTNAGDAALEISARVWDWSMSESGEIRFHEPGTTADSCAAWLTVDPATVRVAQRGQALVRIRVTAPAEFSGSRWGAVMFQLPVTASTSGGQPAPVSARVAVTVYVTPAGAAQGRLRLLSSSVLQGASGDGIQLAMRVRNDGATPVRFRASWQLKATDGRIVRTWEVRTVVSLPGRFREVSLLADERLSPGVYRVTAMARWGERRWAAQDSKLIVGSRSGI